MHAPNPSPTCDDKINRWSRITIEALVLRGKKARKNERAENFEVRIQFDLDTDTDHSFTSSVILLYLMPARMQRGLFTRASCTAHVWYHATETCTKQNDEEWAREKQMKEEIKKSNFCCCSFAYAVYTANDCDTIYVFPVAAFCRCL